jgi:3-oxoacyl-[acyl-carrier-protein] synthase III
MQSQSDAYITSMGTYLPGEPVSNDDMEAYLGRINGKSSRLRGRILKSNGITSRHYAIDQQQRTTHQNSELAALAVLNCLGRSPVDAADVDMLAVASTQGDLPLPGIASIVQSALNLPPCEILSTHGVCSSGIMALKSAVNSVRLGETQNAVVCASELASRLLKGSRYEMANAEALNFEAEFLRWMLSDGAGAMLVQPQARKGGLSLRVNWIKILSYAADFNLCMSCGTADQKAWTVPLSEEHDSSSKPNGGAISAFDGQDPFVGNSGPIVTDPRMAGAAATTMCLDPAIAEPHRFFPNAVSWQDYPSYALAEKAGALLIRQDLKTLEAIVRVGVEGFLKLTSAGKVSAVDIDHFVCHYSSHYFRSEIMKLMKLLGCYIPEEKWFSNLYTKGNTGCAAIFIALEELFLSGRLIPGQTVFCVVPESGRFCTAYMHLTVMEG